HILQDAQPPFFAAQATIAPATEGGRYGELFVGVDPDVACLDRLSQSPCLLVVACPNTGRQGVNTVIGLADQVVDIVERQGNQHRTEDFFLANSGRVFEAFDNCGPIETALIVYAPGRPRSTSQNAAAFFDTFLYITFN